MQDSLVLRKKLLYIENWRINIEHVFEKSS